MANNNYQLRRRHFSRESGKKAAIAYLMERQLLRVGEKDFVDSLRKQAYPQKSREVLIGPLGKPLRVIPVGAL